VRDAAALERELEHLLGDRAAREALGLRGQSVVRENLGGLEKTVEMILRQLPKD
jgi:3-deoxy-D-manno-octulosonic-acid transferase